MMFVEACRFGGQEQSHPISSGGGIDTAKTTQMLIMATKIEKNFIFSIAIVFSVFGTRAFN